MFEKLRGMYKRVIDFILPNRKRKERIFKNQ